MRKSDDTISRQAAINAIENTDCELSSDEWDELTDAIMQVPSAELKKGKWKRLVLGTKEFGTTVMHKCSECKEMTISQYSFCPHCGAKMEASE